MNYLSVESLTKSYGDEALFSDITFGISQGQKVALVGKNGAGKSTLFRIIAGQEAPDSGEVVFRKDVSVRLLSQNPEFEKHSTIRQYLFNPDNEMLTVIARYEQYMQQENADFTTDEYQKVLNQMDALNAWDYEAQVKQIVGRLGIHDLERYADTLSGGEKKRVALANILIERPDFLILDEPTNHLDVDVIEWLQDYLSVSNMSLLLVTHDRYFLETVTTEIIELDDRQLFFYNGNYTYFLEKRSERATQKKADIEKARNLLRTELDWLHRMPKARGTKAKYRVDAVKELQAAAREKLGNDSLSFKIAMPRLGNKILELEEVSKGYGDELLIRNFSYTFKKGDRIGIVGRNGSGKTTLLNMLTGKLAPDTGTVVLGETIRFGHYRQENADFAVGKKVIEVVKDVAEFVALNDGSTISAEQFLQHFLFPPPVQYTPVEKLSGGERRRLQLVRVLLERPNFLILDEPTNDLDIYTMNALENYLLGFGGILLVVSHDRYFLDKLTDHLFVFEGAGLIKDFPGTYFDYKQTLAVSEEKKSREAVVKAPKPATVVEISKEKKKLTYKEQREYEALSEEIEKLEKQKAIFVDKLNKGSEDHTELTVWAQEIEQISAAIDEKSDRWLELSELAG
jgi:ATP-binding cassette subfamily F protein uup